LLLDLVGLAARGAPACGSQWPLTDDDILRRLFALNQQRAAKGVAIGRERETPE
jgi:hypothetical protein